MWIYYTLFIWVSVDDKLDCFQVLAITNKVTMNIHYKSLYGCMVSFLAFYQGVLILLPEKWNAWNHTIGIC